MWIWLTCHPVKCFNFVVRSTAFFQTQVQGWGLAYESHSLVEINKSMMLLLRANSFFIRDRTLVVSFINGYWSVFSRFFGKHCNKSPINNSKSTGIVVHFQSDTQARSSSAVRADQRTSPHCALQLSKTKSSPAHLPILTPLLFEWCDLL